MNMDMKKSTLGCLVFVGLFLCLPALLIGSIRLIYGIQFNRQCTSYLKMSADATNITLAKERLDKAIAYLEENNLTKGNTSVIYTSPENDIAEWYKNLKAAQNNLDNFPAEATEADVNTTLVKLRETLLDAGEDGQIVTRPDNIHLFPHNVGYFVMSSVSIIIFCLGAMLAFCSFMFWLES